MNIRSRSPISHSSKFESLLDFSKTLHTILIIALVGIGLICLNVLRTETTPSDIATFVLFGLTVVFYVFYRLGFEKAAGMGLLVSLTVMLSFIMGFADGIHDDAMIAFPAFIIIAGLLFGKQTVPWITVIIILEVSILYLLTQLGLIIPFDGNVHTEQVHFAIILFLLLASAILIWLTVHVIELNVNKVINSEKQMLKAYEDTLQGWRYALELYDKEIIGHSKRVTELCSLFSQALHMDDEKTEHISRGALLHDIGKFGVPDVILQKLGPLAPTEREEIEHHPQYAFDLLKDIPFLQPSLDIPYCHHEQWDGKGYPQGLEGDMIPIGARIFSIVDNWDALTSDRPYRKAWSKEKTCDYLIEEKGKKFDPELVDIFLDQIICM